MQRCSHPTGECPGRADIRGLCRRHYQRWRRTGDLGPAGDAPQSPAKGPSKRTARGLAQNQAFLEFQTWRGPLRSFDVTYSRGMAALRGKGLAPHLVVLPTWYAWVRYGWVRVEPPRFDKQPGIRRVTVTRAAPRRVDLEARIA